MPSGRGDGAGHVEASVTTRRSRRGRGGPRTRTASPIGTFTNMTQRHETSSVSTPPATRPVAPPAADTVV